MRRVESIANGTAEKGINAYASNSRVFCKISQLITEDRQCSCLHRQTFTIKVSVSVWRSRMIHW